MENEKVRPGELLKEHQKGRHLYSVIHGFVVFDHVGENCIVCNSCDPIVNKPIVFDLDGKELIDFAKYTNECVLFPDKDTRDWKNFKPIKPRFKKDDIIKEIHEPHNLYKIVRVDPFTYLLADPNNSKVCKGPLNIVSCDENYEIFSPTMQELKLDEFVVIDGETRIITGLQTPDTISNIGFDGELFYENEIVYDIISEIRLATGKESFEFTQELARKGKAIIDGELKDAEDLFDIIAKVMNEKRTNKLEVLDKVKKSLRTHIWKN